MDAPDELTAPPPSAPASPGPALAVAAPPAAPAAAADPSPAAPPPAPSAAAIASLVCSRAALAAALSSAEGGSSSLFERKTAAPFAGMSNQGATCYLNSLLQSLFFVAPFREAVLAWRFDAARHGAPLECIPLQLQRIFARLALSPRACVGSAALTKSFGWEGEEAFAQHDAQELMRVLFEALQIADCGSGDSGDSGDRGSGRSGARAAPSFASLVPALFEGRCRDTLRCLP